MKSLETILAETIGKMKPATKAKFKHGISLENSIAIAESLLAEDGPVRESIRRNNGSSSSVSESRDVFAETDKVLFEGMAKARSTAKGLENVVEVNGSFQRNLVTVDGSQLSESQRQDYEFAVLVGLKPEEALRVATSNCLREN